MVDGTRMESLEEAIHKNEALYQSNSRAIFELAKGQDEIRSLAEQNQVKLEKFEANFEQQQATMNQKIEFLTAMMNSWRKESQTNAESGPRSNETAAINSWRNETQNAQLGGFSPETPLMALNQGAEIVDEFNKLKQLGKLEDYNERFEDLRAGMIVYNPLLPEESFVLSYISGLRSEIRSLVKIGRPIDLIEAKELARLHYEAVREWILDGDPVEDSKSTRVGESSTQITYSGQEIDGDLGQEGVEDHKIFWRTNTEVEESTDSRLEIDEKTEKLQPQFKVNLHHVVVNSETELQEIGERVDVWAESIKSNELVARSELSALIVLLIDLLEIRLLNGRTGTMIDIGLNSLGISEIGSAQQVFVESPKKEGVFLTEWECKKPARSDEVFGDMGIRDIKCNKSSIQLRNTHSHPVLIIFDPGGSAALYEYVVSQGILVFDPGGRSLKSYGYFFGVQKRRLGIREANLGPPVLPFDRGKGDFEATLGSREVGLNRRLINYWLDLSLVIFFY